MRVKKGGNQNTSDRLANRSEYKETIDLSEAIVLTDDYAPVDTLALKSMSLN